MKAASDIASKHELDAPPWRRVDSTIMSTARAIRRAYEQRFARLGLNLSQASLIAFVFESGPLSQAELAERLGLGRPATGTLIDTLERRGLVRRDPDPSDRRVWLVSTTREGRHLAEPVTEIDRELRNELRTGISRAERRQLAELLVRLQSNLADVFGEDD